MRWLGAPRVVWLFLREDESEALAAACVSMQTSWAAQVVVSKCLRCDKGLFRRSKGGIVIRRPHELVFFLCSGNREVGGCNQWRQNRRLKTALPYPRRIASQWRFPVLGSQWLQKEAWGQGCTQVTTEHNYITSKQNFLLPKPEPVTVKGHASVGASLQELVNVGNVVCKWSVKGAHIIDDFRVLRQTAHCFIHAAVVVLWDRANAVRCSKVFVQPKECDKRRQQLTLFVQRALVISLQSVERSKELGIRGGYFGNGLCRRGWLVDLATNKRVQFCKVDTQANLISVFLRGHDDRGALQLPLVSNLV